MSGYLNLGRENDHRCRPPGWLQRRRDGVKLDTRWECDCGAEWRWSYGSWDLMRPPGQPPEPVVIPSFTEAPPLKGQTMEKGWRLSSREGR